MDAILGEVTLTRRRRKLDEMTKGGSLGDAYAATISRIRSLRGGRSKLGMEVLMWVSHSERPLHVDELRHALGVEGSTDLDIGNLPAVETLLECALGLITVEKSSSTVRLVHYTLQEYLSHNPNIFLRPHATIAEVCLTYLNFPYVRGFSPALRSIPPAAPFVEYASCYWGAHARRETTESVKTLALRLLDGYDKHISSRILLLHGVPFRYQLFDWKGRPRGFTGLHGAAYLGHAEITAALLRTNKWDAQATDLHGNRAIAWAVRRGHEEVVKVLLERSDVNPDEADKLSRTLLSLAAENGHGGMVKMLLKRSGVDPDKADKCGRTPLLWAAKNGHEAVVRLLLERNVNPNTADNEHSRTPILWAAENGHERVVRALLERNDVDPDRADKWSRTPLSLAAENGHEGVLRMLLKRSDVNPDIADTEYSRTPLWWAAKGGHEGVVRRLLGRGGVNPDAADTEYGRTPLWWAARGGHERVAGMLLGRNDVNPDTADTEHGRTPLLWAAENGHDRIVKILLELHNVGPNKATRWSRTPLWQAAGNGHEGVVAMLLERDDVNPNSLDTMCGQTPLRLAAKNGHERIVRMLLKRNDISPDTVDAEYGRTPLLWAAKSGHEEIVRMLLERSDVNPHIRDTIHGHTPLGWAVKNGHQGIVRMLLESIDSPFKGTHLFWCPRIESHTSLPAYKMHLPNMATNRASPSPTPAAESSRHLDSEARADAKDVDSSPGIPRCLLDSPKLPGYRSHFLLLHFLAFASLILSLSVVHPCVSTPLSLYIYSLLICLLIAFFTSLGYSMFVNR